mgnify:CR=1 FL=1
MSKSGIATYNKRTNELEVIREGESTKRKIKCTNLNPKSEKVHGVEIDGDEIYVLAGPNSNDRPNKKYKYSFRSLSGGGSNML